VWETVKDFLSTHVNYWVVQLVPRNLLVLYVPNLSTVHMPSESRELASADNGLGGGFAAASAGRDTKTLWCWASRCCRFVLKEGEDFGKTLVNLGEDMEKNRIEVFGLAPAIAI